MFGIFFLALRNHVYERKRRKRRKAEKKNHQNKQNQTEKKSEIDYKQRIPTLNWLKITLKFFKENQDSISF